ncbi:MAG: hypothetical protein AAGH15_09650, partial [Myxococcota bacterium]
AELTDVVIDLTETNELATPTEGFGVASANGSTLTLRRAYVADNASTSARVQSEGALVLEDVRIVGAFPDGLAGGRGLEVVSGGTATLTRVRIDEVPANGILSEGTLVATDLEIRDVYQLPGELQSGSGIQVIGADATATLERVHVERVRVGGVAVDGERGEVMATDLSVVELVGPPGTTGGGVAVLTGARAELHCMLGRRTSYPGLLVASGSSAVAEDVVLSDGGMLAGGTGLAVQASGASAVTLARVVVEDAAGGVGAADPMTRLTAVDLRVRGTERFIAPGEAETALAVLAIAGARVSLERASIQNNQGFGITALVAQLDARDVVVRSTRNRNPGTFSAGALAARPATLMTLERTLFDDNAQFGLVAADRARMVVRDTVVAGTSGGVPDAAGEPQAGGVGAGSADGASLELDRVALSGNREVGIASVGTASSASLRDVVVEGTLEAECAPACSQPPGNSLSVAQGGTLDGETFLLNGAATCGLQLGEGSDAELRRGIVRGHPVGVCLQRPDFDVERVRTDVAYEDNDVLVESTSFPEPLPPDLSSLDGLGE